MVTSYGPSIDSYYVGENLRRIGGQIFRLLPLREEGGDWQKPLDTLIVELLGMANLFSDQKDLLALTAKLEGIKDPSVDFAMYRRTIFECCTICSKCRQQIDA